jgi:methylated-DNA-[protein]-cysteine S-methyltransferase
VIQNSVYFDCVKTRFGTFQIAASTRGLTSIRFPGTFRFQNKNGNMPPKAKKALESVKRFLKNYFAGHFNHGFKVPIDWQNLSLFQARVLKMLRKIKPASITTYGDLAKQSGYPAGARAVGNALGRNPLPILIPCHRVIRKAGTLGGFSGGISWKRRLLDLEKKGNN